MPLRQHQLADALGLSPVHVNRVLQDLRARGLIGRSRSAIEIADRPGLVTYGEFDGAYLRLAARGELIAGEDC